VAATGSAILFHLTRLCVAANSRWDHGELFALAIVVTAYSIVLLLMHRQELPILGRAFSTT
jgi:hypothetical protein